MGNCIFCGREADSGRDSHGECIAVYSNGKKWITSMVGAFVSNEREIYELKQAINLVAKLSYISESSIHSLVLQGYKRALDQALEDHLLSREEEHALEAIQSSFNLTDDELKENGTARRLLYARVIRLINIGGIFEFPTDDIRLPFNLQKSEKVVWLFADVGYYEEQTRSRYQIGAREVSLELASLYLKTSELNVEVIQDEKTVRVDTGIMGITTKHIYFVGPNKSLRISYNNIVTIKHYSDGIRIVQDTPATVPQAFVTEEGWFTYNLVANLARRA